MMQAINLGLSDPDGEIMRVLKIVRMDATLMNLILTVAGGLMFSVVLGAVSKLILDKTALV